MTVEQTAADGTSNASAALTWLITGASRGLGRALAEAVVARGDRVLAAARRPQTVDDLVARWPDQVRSLALDLTDTAQVAAAAGAAFGWGPLDVVVNNAGYPLLGAIEEATDLQLRRQMETNFFGPVTLTRALLPRLRAQGRGHLVFIGSIDGRIAVPGGGWYAAGKYALGGVAQALAGEVAPLGLRVTVVEPGPFRTDVVRSADLTNPVAAYADTAGKQRARLHDVDGHQPGSPELFAQTVLDVVDQPDPPVHLVLGGIAYDRLHQDLTAQLHDLQEHETASRAADYAANSSAR